MKPLALWLLSGLLVLETIVFAQTVASKRISSAEAVRIVSRLPIGMQQAEVRKVLERNGFEKVSGATSFHSCFQQQDLLANGYALELEYKPTSETTNRDDTMLQIATSRLQQASLLSNGVYVVSIALTNAP